METKVNAVCGLFQKIYSKSFMLNIDLKSELGEKLFSINPYITMNNPEYSEVENRHNVFYNEPKYIEKEVVVIQVMMCGELRVLAEVMWKDDYNALDTQKKK